MLEIFFTFLDYLFLFLLYYYYDDYYSIFFEGGILSFTVKLALQRDENINGENKVPRASDFKCDVVEVVATLDFYYSISSVDIST